MNNPLNPVSIPKLIDEVVEMYSKRLEDRGIKVERRYRCSVCPGGCLVADAGELRQVVSNLIINAFDAIRDHGTLHVRVARLSQLRERKDVIRVTIADTGSGVRPEHLKRLFEPFFTTKENFGTGLGLI